MKRITKLACAPMLLYALVFSNSFVKNRAMSALQLDDPDAVINALRVRRQIVRTNIQQDGILAGIVIIRADYCGCVITFGDAYPPTKMRTAFETQRGKYADVFEVQLFPVEDSDDEEWELDVFQNNLKSQTYENIDEEETLWYLAEEWERQLFSGMGRGLLCKLLLEKNFREDTEIVVFAAGGYGLVELYETIGFARQSERSQLMSAPVELLLENCQYAENEKVNRSINWTYEIIGLEKSLSLKKAE